MRKLLPTLFLFILLISVVSAAPPTTTIFAGDTGLELKISSIRYTQENKPYDFHVHVFNKSNGYPYLIENDVKCVLHIYSVNGSHLLKANLTFDEDEWEYEIPGNLAIPGQYPYTVYCWENITMQGGFINDYIIINHNGKEPYNELALILGLILTTFAYLFFAFKLDDNHFILKLLLIFFSVYNIILVPSVFLSGSYNVTVSFFKLTTNFFRMFGMYFLVYIIYYQFKDTESWLRSKFK